MSKPNLPRITDELPQSMNPKATSDATNTSPVGSPLPAPRVSARNLPPIPVSSAPPKTGPVGAVNIRIGPDADDDDDGEMMKTIPATDLAELLAKRVPPPGPTPPLPPRRNTPDSVVTNPEGEHPREEQPFNPFDDVSLPGADDDYDDLNDVGVKTKVGELPRGPQAFARGKSKPQRQARDEREEADDRGEQEEDYESTNGTESTNGPRPKRTVLWIVVGLFVTGMVIGGVAWALGLFTPPKPVPVVRVQKPQPKPQPKATAPETPEKKQLEAEKAAQAEKDRKEEEALAAKKAAEESALVKAAEEARLAAEKEKEADAKPKPAPVRSKPAPRPRPAPKPAPAPVEAAPAAAKGTGQITLVISPAGLKVTHNGVELGKTPLFNAKIPAGRQVLKLTDAAGATKTLTVIIKPDETTSVRNAWDSIK
jgi:hypothetical protein